MLRADVEGKGAYDNFLPQKRGRVKLVENLLLLLLLLLL